MVALLAPLPLACVSAADDSVAGRIQAAYKTPLGTSACPGEDEDTAAARGAVARVRAMAGLSPLRCDGAASLAATHHCDYVVANHVFTHVQTPGRPEFTGVNFWDRLSVQHFTEKPSAEVLTSYSGAMAVEDAEGLVNSVYHRAPFLRGEQTSFGYGHGRGCATIDFGRIGEAGSSDARVVWPPDGSSNVPTTFHADREVPNPLPGSVVVGSPVSLVAGGTLVDVGATLTDPSGAVLPAVLITQATDANKLVHAGEAHLVPRAPLAANTQYVARFHGHFAKGGAFEMTTTFTTGAY